MINNTSTRQDQQRLTMINTDHDYDTDHDQHDADHDQQQARRAAHAHHHDQQEDLRQDLLLIMSQTKINSRVCGPAGPARPWGGAPAAAIRRSRTEASGRLLMARIAGAVVDLETRRSPEILSDSMITRASDGIFS
jgi:hypothetical protein